MGVDRKWDNKHHNYRHGHDLNRKRALLLYWRHVKWFIVRDSIYEMSSNDISIPSISSSFYLHFINIFSLSGSENAINIINFTFILLINIFEVFFSDFDIIIGKYLPSLWFSISDLKFVAANLMFYWYLLLIFDLIMRYLPLIKAKCLENTQNFTSPI